MMKKLSTLTILFVTIFMLMACGERDVPESQPATDTQTPVAEQNDSGESKVSEVSNNDFESKQIPEVSDEDLTNVPEDALAIPMTELHEHELYKFFDEWMLCHLTGDCTQGAWGTSVSINNDDLTFEIPDRSFMPATEDYLYACETNERNNLLICEIVGEGIPDGGMLSVGDNSIQYPEMTVKITEATTFEVIHTDGHTNDESEGTRSDLEELVNGTSTSYTLNIRHEEVNGELIATHIQMMIFPW